MNGPYETQREALDLPAVQAVYEAFRADPGVGRMAPHSLRMLEEACAAAGVGLGAYDRRVLAWLAGWEPQVCAVIAGLISRAHDAGATPQADRLTALADWMEQRLDDEDYDQALLAESGITQLRELAALARAGGAR